MSSEVIVLNFPKLMSALDSLVWGPPLLLLLVGGGIYFTIRTRALHLRHFGYIFKNTLLKMFEKSEAEEGGVTPFQALANALAATVGTGNIVGVSVAILTGGPGAVFWMWVAAFFGMCTKYFEIVLSIVYRTHNSKGEWAGGPMYYIDKGLKQPWLAKLFAIFAALACFGIGNTVQSNAIAGVVKANFGISPVIVGIVLTLITAIVVAGGIQSITRVTEKLVPFMAALYIIGAIVVLFFNIQNVPAAFLSIFTNAFQTQAAVGGVAGFTFMQIVRAGVSRGLFTNEAGLGSSPIAHASATTDHPVRQGMWGVTEVFVDTFLVCTMTAMVILSSGILGTEADASSLVSKAFGSTFAGGRYIVTFGLVLFAFSTILGWEFYGETSARYLLGDKVAWPFKIVFILMVFLGSTMDLGVAWTIANILNGLMAFPNLIALVGLSGVVVALSKDFFADDHIRTSAQEWQKLLK
ncbi:MAG: alanine/glycine:cation symporter family protein [Tissierellia bacterium]|nr:alanine/glycine:cation symporter family protein [Tissierellia bacterium]